ncbi:unnamed protein product [Didymodactylos carnosus]|uniref:Uncharacterized protein n=1 Tax=Didymodactylos carnosus TaxID=1234261 RepID=A0A815IYF2_9BILA|nr:unnamed protein product [Didymodactylos carnosus]CAF4259254.1 unnamed protein product [Didymodactylos carnosus]
MSNPCPLVIVFHGSKQTGEKMRQSCGYEFDRLADQYKFIVAYPNGYKNHWNDNRLQAPYEARQLNIDDKRFIQKLIDQQKPSIVFAVGYSNGGHFVFRLALEMTERFAACAAISANLPTDGNTDVRLTHQPIPMLIMNGTNDKINPYNGGEVSFWGFQSRGQVRSSWSTAQYFADQYGLHSLHVSSKYLTNNCQSTTWNDDGNKPKIVLLTIHKGGHVIPQPNYRAPRILGLTDTKFNGPKELWHFLQSQFEK